MQQVRTVWRYQRGHKSNDR